MPVSAAGSKPPERDQFLPSLGYLPGVKAALDRVGLVGGAPRSPLRPLGAPARALLEELLRVGQLTRVGRGHRHEFVQVRLRLRILLRRDVGTASIVVDLGLGRELGRDLVQQLHRLVGAGIVLWLAWVAGTVIGVLGGEALGDPIALGLDAAFPALFLALLTLQLESRRAVAAALTPIKAANAASRR